MPDVEQTAAAPNKKLTKEEKKKQKEEKKRQKKALKEAAREGQDLEAEEGTGGALTIIFVTFLIVVIWLAILALLVKLDVGGFGSNVLRPILKDVPVLQMILPKASEEELALQGEEGAEDYAGYSNLKDAVEQIKRLELELEEAKKGDVSKDEQMAALNEEINRLKTFENNQVEFEKIKDEFYDEVVFGENAPGAENYRKYYESIDPESAAALYRQAITQIESDAQVQEYAKAYSAMKPKAAAAIFEQMTDNLDLAVKILNTMNADTRGSILAAMDPQVAAMLTKLMDPDQSQY